MKRFALLALLIAAPITAAERPRPGQTDAHIQSIFYDPDQVVQLRGHFGYQTMIEFDEGERIENVAIGDALGWQVTPNKRANKLFLKPLDRKATTNMAVVTDRRRYTFSLTVATPGKQDAAAPWVVRFRYPEPVLLVAEVIKPTPPDPSTFDRRYVKSGARELWPTEVYDDGRATYFSWPKEVALPAIFAIGPDGQESLVNASVRDGMTVVQRTATRFLLRSGKALATISHAGAGK